MIGSPAPDRAIFRSVENPVIRGLLHTPSGTRIPRRVPLVVDNLWEWARPKGLPSRRSSAFASPTTELAARFGPENGTACEVHFAGEYLAAQISNLPDAGLHSDIDRISLLCAEHASLPTFSLLWTPLLQPNSVDRIMTHLPPSVRQALTQSIVFWNDVTRFSLDDRGTDKIGEIFFSAPAGYYLVPCSRELARPDQIIPAVGTAYPARH